MVETSDSFCRPARFIASCVGGTDRCDAQAANVACWLLVSLFPLSALAQSPDATLDAEAPSSRQLLPTDAAQTYRDARRLLRDSKPHDPHRASELAESMAPLPVADDRRFALLVETRMHRGHPIRAIDATKAWQHHAPRAVDRIDAALSRGELHLLLGNPQRALEASASVRTDLARLDARPGDVRHLNARWLRLRHDAYRGLGRMAAAAQLARRLKVSFPAEDATHQAGLVDDFELTVAERFRRGKRQYEAWAYHEARRTFQELVDDSPSNDVPKSIRRDAKWHLAHIALNKLRDDPERAQSLFDNLSNEGGEHAEEALYQLARSQMRQEHYDAALKTLNRYRERYPDGDHTEDVFYYRGWLPYDHRHNDRAIEGFRAYLDRYGTWGPRSSYIYGFLAWTHMRQADWGDAIQTYEKMEPYGNMLVWGKALYWMAYAEWKREDEQQALARLDELRDTYPVTYYGVLGEQLRLQINGHTPDAADIWWPEASGRADDIDTPGIEDVEFQNLSAEVADDWRRVRALVTLDERERARHALEPIYRRLIRAAPDDQRDRAIYAVGDLVGDYNRMWRAATDGSISAMAKPPASDSLTAVMAYPRAYRSVVREVADEFDLSEHLMYAIMRQESRYAPGQVSHTNAVGALQMIPSTARKVANDLGVEYRPREFHRPSVGFRFSGFYMRKLLDLFEGKLVPMAAAYNSGPAPVVEWFGENPDASFPWLIEEFAYNEGRNYCRKVAEHFLRYLYLYNDDESTRRELLRQLFPQSRDITFPEEIGY